MIYQAIYIVFCFILDFWISLIVGIDYAASFLVFIPSLGFGSLILISKKMSLLDALMWVMTVGFIYGLFIPGNLFLYPLLFAAAMLLVRIWSTNLNESVFELLILCLVAILIKDYLLFVYMQAVGITVMNVIYWIKTYLFMAIVGNAFFLILIIYLYRYISKIQIVFTQRKQKKEHVNWR